MKPSSSGKIRSFPFYAYAGTLTLGVFSVLLFLGLSGIMTELPPLSQAAPELALGLGFRAAYKSL